MAYALPGGGRSVTGTTTGSSTHHARSRPGNGWAGRPSTMPTSASAVTTPLGRGNVIAAPGTAAAASINVHAKLASVAASVATHSAPGNASAMVASTASVAGTSTKLKYGIATRFAIGATMDIPPNHAATIGTSPKLIVSCSAASDFACRPMRATAPGSAMRAKRRVASATSSATAPNDSQNDADSTANGSSASTISTATASPCPHAPERRLTATASPTRIITAERCVGTA